AWILAPGSWGSGPRRSTLGERPWASDPRRATLGERPSASDPKAGKSAPAPSSTSEPVRTGLFGHSRWRSTPRTARWPRFSYFFPPIDVLDIKIRRGVPALEAHFDGQPCPSPASRGALTSAHAQEDEGRARAGHPEGWSGPPQHIGGRRGYNQFW